MSDPVSALLVLAERSLTADFPPQAQAHKVLATIARAAGAIGSTPLQRALELLTGKRIVAAELPVSLRPSKDRRYRVTDPYLRFWLHVLGPSMEEIERGRDDLTLARIRENWISWRGRAVEPLIREALARTLPDDQLSATPGGYWTRTNDVEIDIIGADRAPIAQELLFLGSIKWLEQSPFGRHDLAAFHRHRAALTDEPVPIVAVSRSGVESRDSTQRTAPVIS